MKNKDLKQMNDAIKSINRGIRVVRVATNFMLWYKKYMEVFAIIVSAIVSTAWAITPIIYIYTENTFWIKVFLGVQAIVLIIWSQSIWFNPFIKYVVKRRRESQLKRDVSKSQSEINLLKLNRFKALLIVYSNGHKVIATNEEPMFGGYMCDSDDVYPTPDIDGFIGFYKVIASNLLADIPNIDDSIMREILKRDKRKNSNNDLPALYNIEIELEWKPISDHCKECGCDTKTPCDNVCGNRQPKISNDTIKITQLL
jgi:hypothetical protein